MTSAVSLAAFHLSSVAHLVELSGRDCALVVRGRAARSAVLRLLLLLLLFPSVSIAPQRLDKRIEAGPTLQEGERKLLHSALEEHSLLAQVASHVIRSFSLR